MPDQMEVSIPTSGKDATRVFGQAAEITVVGGGTVVMPALRSGRLAPKHVMLLTRTGLDRVERERDELRIGAAARLADLADLPEPLASAVRGVADPEIRGQATIGGNLCVNGPAGVPVGDLQGPLIAIDAKVRWSNGTDERLDGVEQFLRRSPNRRLILGLEMAVPEHGAFAALRRPHSHGYTPMSVSAAVVDGELRLGATGLEPHGIRLRLDEDLMPAGADQLEPPDDALASAWYRRQMLPVLVRRCLDQIESAQIEGAL
jgi:CO/xanthine dehydrogenase FAD-binding subunit